MHSNMNFPAPLAVLGFLAGMAGLFLSALLAVVLVFVRQTRWLRRVGIVVGSAVAVYFVLLLAFSLGSREVVLAPGQEKYFCEIDCHLAYSVQSSRKEVSNGSDIVQIALRTRFDENTISAHRPKDAPLAPNPRVVVLMDEQGRRFEPSEMTGTPITHPLIPSDSYVTDLTFTVPADAKELRLLITSPGWEEHLLIGDENSFAHKKTYLAVAAETRNAAR